MNKSELSHLLKIGGVISLGWGCVVLVKGLLDLFIFSPFNEFISLDEWIRYSVFESLYGGFCFIFGIYLFKVTQHLVKKNNIENLRKND